MSRVFVGLSGGVDSAVSAALLLEAGHDVVTVFMKNWSGVTAGIECPWESDWASARAVAAHLNIPIKLYDFEDYYRQTVGKYLIETYQKGLTPNPDIMCNEEIKFKAFLEKCRQEGAEYIATGHYAQIKNGFLYRGKDSSKDQSYFLYRMGSAALAHVLFPLGELTKKEVRAKAQALGLPNAKRPDSQGICFVGPVPMKEFLHEFIDYQPGDIVDETGNVIGQHDGVFFYTIGQRHGLGVGGGKPYFVCSKDVKKNILYVTTNLESTSLNKNQLTIADTLWYEQPQPSKKYDVQIRYRSAATPAIISPDHDNYQVVFDTPQRAITPGQSAVIYDGDRVIGGGIIQE